MACARQYRPTERCSARPTGFRRAAADHQQVARLVGDVDEHLTRVAALDPGPHLQAVGDAAEALVERVGSAA